MKPQVPKKVAKYRANELAKIQEEIVENKNLNFIGKQLEVVIEDVLDKNTYIGRSQYNSPNVDTIVYINSTKQLQIGDFCNIIVTNVVDKFDLQGDII